MSEITKELSKQICEQCGIEPIFRYTYSFAGSTRTVESKSGFAAHINRLQHSACMHRYKFIKVEKIFPDFHEPSDFVRLVELQVSKKLILGRYLQGSGTYGAPFSQQWYDRRSFLIILADYLSRADECFARNRNKIKQAIKAEFGGEG